MVLFHSIASNIIKIQKTRQKLGKNIASGKYYHYLCKQIKIEVLWKRRVSLTPSGTRN